MSLITLNFNSSSKRRFLLMFLGIQNKHARAKLKWIIEWIFKVLFYKIPGTSMNNYTQNELQTLHFL